MKKRKKTAKKRGGARKVTKRAKGRKRARPKATKRRKVATRRKRKPAAGRRPTPAKRTRAGTVRAARPAVRAASARAAAPTHLAALVLAALRREGYDPSPEVVATITAVGAGYRKGPAADPGFGLPFDADAEVAPELVRRFATGDRGTPLDLRMHRPQVRATVLMNLEQNGFAGVNETVKETLTSLSLGSWNPDTDEHAKANAIAGFVVLWYRHGL